MNFKHAITSASTTFVFGTSLALANVPSANMPPDIRSKIKFDPEIKLSQEEIKQIEALEKFKKQARESSIAGIIHHIVRANKLLKKDKNNFWARVMKYEAKEELRKRRKEGSIEQEIKQSSTKDLKDQFRKIKKLTCNKWNRGGDIFVLNKWDRGKSLFVFIKTLENRIADELKKREEKDVIYDLRQKVPSKHNFIGNARNVCGLPAAGNKIKSL